MQQYFSSHRPGNSLDCPNSTRLYPLSRASASENHRHLLYITILLIGLLADS